MPKPAKVAVAPVSKAPRMSLEAPQELDAFVDGVNLGPIPQRLEDDNHRIYSWAYHRTECIATQAGLVADDIRTVSRMKARRVSALAKAQV